MKISEIIGLLVFQCNHCGKKFVVNTVDAKNGFQYKCECGCSERLSGYESKIDVFFHSIGLYDSRVPKDMQRENDRYYGERNAMPLEEYKRMLAGVILEGKKYKITKHHKNAVNVKVDTADYENLYATLRNLGFGKEEAIAKVDIAIEQGFVRDTEIIKYILSLE